MDSIDGYVTNIDHMYLSSSIIMYDPKFPQDGLYTKVGCYLYHRDSNKSELVKIIKTTKNINTAYYKNDKLVYVKNIVTVHGNYSELMEEYFDGDSIIYSKSKLIEEHIIKITYNYIAPMGGGHDITFSIDKDSVKYLSYYPRKDEQTNLVTPNWGQLLKSINLMDFDDIENGPCLSYIDESCYSYIITTDYRTHTFGDALRNNDNQIRLEKIKEFLGFIKQLENTK